MSTSKSPDGSKIRFTQVFKWHCPLCHATNYHDGIPVPEEDIRLTLKLLEFEAIPEDMRAAIMLPDEVRCVSCGLIFYLDESFDDDDHEEEEEEEEDC